MGAPSSAFAELLRSKPLFGMIHLPPLPGSPRGRETLDEVLEVALDEARILTDAGLDGLIVENVGDTPFFRESVPTTTVAALAVIVREVRAHTRLAVGVNLLTGAVDLPVFIGSGIGLDNAAAYYAACDGLLIGETDVKVDGVWGGRSLGSAYAEVVRRCRG